VPEIKGRNQTAIFYFLEKRMNLGTRSSILVSSYSACLNILNGQQHYVPQFFKGDIVGPNNPLECFHFMAQWEGVWNAVRSKKFKDNRIIEKICLLRIWSRSH
jgi:hypothetical protein